MSASTLRGTAQALPSGSELRDSYRIERVLGAGGFAITYLACHIGLDHLVAIKEYMPFGISMRAKDGAAVFPEQGSGKEFRRGLVQFAQEARTLASFNHPGIVSVNDIFEANGTAYMVMEYVEGESLAKRMQRAGTLDEKTLRTLLDPILDALEVIHARGVLHRDIKPANIYLQEDGKSVVLDFGNSRDTQGSKKGSFNGAFTPGFAPTEQYSTNIRQGPWTDIYGLGATLYIALSGIVPPEAPDRAVSDKYRPAHEVVEGKYSATLLAAIDRALAVDPKHRPRSITAFRRLLGGRAAAPSTIIPALYTEKMQGLPGLGKQFARSILPWRMIAPVLFVLIAGGSIYSSWSEHRRVEAQRVAAEQVYKASERARAEAARLSDIRLSETERWKRAANTANEYARRKAANQAARRRAVAQWVRRKAAEAARRRAEAQRQARLAGEQVARRTTKRKASKPPPDLLAGVRDFFESLLPR